MAKRLTLSRRDLIARGLAAAAAAALPAGTAAAQGTAQAAAAAPLAPVRPKMRFFTAKEFDILDSVAELILPATARSGGARAAGVARMIDTMLADLFDQAERKSWRDDLAEIDRLAELWFKKPYLRLDTQRQTELLERISGNEDKPAEPGEYAFGTIKWTVSEAYYRSRIGIHDELSYLGNVPVDEFVGVDVSRR